MGCEGADSCGPTSDWPTCNTPRPGAGSDNPGENEPGTGTNPGGGKRDSGSSGGKTELDAGLSGPPVWNGDSHADSGSGSVDAGIPPTSWDGGCTIDSDGRDAGACYGVYCDVPQLMFSRLASDQGACLAADDLALACEGELARVVTKCAQDDVLMLGLGQTVTTCAVRAPSLGKASEGCIDCYVEETLCALQRCLTACLTGSEDCTKCRREQCGSDFSSCSGLPD